MLRVGENSGELARALAQVSDSYQREVRLASERLLTLLEPTLTVLLGGLLLWMVSAVLGPVYSALAAGRQRMKAGKTHEWIIVLGDTAAWAWPPFASQPPHAVLPPTPKATPRYCAAQGESHGETQPGADRPGLRNPARAAHTGLALA